MEFPSVTGLIARAGNGQSQSISIKSKVRYAKLHDHTASISAAPESALQAAWAVVLGAYVGVQDSVTFATAVDRFRSRLHVSNAAEACIYVANQIRVNFLDPETSIPVINGDALRQLTQSNHLAGKHTIRASTCHSRLGKQGTLVAFYSSSSSDDSEIADGAIELIDEFALILSARPCDNGHLILQATYKDSILTRSGAETVLAQLEDVLAHILARPTEHLQASTTAIRASLLSISNQDCQEASDLNVKASFLHTSFEDFAQREPSRIALEFRHDIGSNNITFWTYAELDARANKLASHLVRKFGSLTNKVIPICMDRRPELYVAILGILKSGAAWCPIDTAFPARRRHNLIARTGSELLLTAEPSHVEESEGVPQGAAVVDITKVEDTELPFCDLSKVEMGSLAYLIWTSGTTGDPKGVPIHHEAAVTSMKVLQRCIPTDVTGGIVRCLQFSHFTFDVFVQDLFYTWTVGGTIISSTREIMLGSFPELANQTKATHAHLTPAFAASVPRRRCKTLGVITMIGEKLSQVVADDWSQDLRAFNTYGPAETTIVSTVRQFGGLKNDMRSENVGFPLPSVSAFVMRDGKPVMRQGVGELALAGPQLSKGYWRDPDKTAARFVWNSRFARYLYMTGDMVRQLHDGSLEFVGREDDLIKIQGIRVELSEISFGLRSCHPLVQHVETQYLSRPDRPSKVIVAFLAAPQLKGDGGPLISIGKGVPIARSALEEARKQLPEYMIPRVFLIVDSIPRTPSNKTDKAALQAVYDSSDLGKWEGTIASHDGHVPEAEKWSQDEVSIIVAISEISGTSQGAMSRVSDLRSIGIDSIAATRLAPKLNTLGHSISVAGILQCQTLDNIFQCSKSTTTSTRQFYLEGFHQEWYARVTEKLERYDFTVCPILPLQESLLSETMRNADDYWYHTFLSLDHQIDLARLQEAWVHVVTETEALRTGFIPSAAVSNSVGESGVTFFQLIYGQASLDWRYAQLSEERLHDVASREARAVTQRHQRDAFKDPPLAVAIFEQTSGYTMMISIHHAIRDEASLDFILDDVRKSYCSEIVQPRHQLQAALQLMIRTEAQVQEDEEFWSDTLKDFDINESAISWPDLAGEGSEQADGFLTHTRALSVSYTHLKTASARLGATSIAALLRVAWGSILLMYLDVDATVFAETWSDRIDDPELFDTVGPLTSVSPVPFRADGTVREVLASQSQFQQESRPHRSVYGRIIRNLLGRHEDQSLYPAVFNFLLDSGEDSTSSLWTKADDILGLAVEHPLALNVIPSSTGVVGLELVASRRVMNEDHLAMLGSQINSFVEMMLERPDVPLMQLPSHMPKDVLSISTVGFSEEVKGAFRQSPTAWVDHYATLHPHWPAAEFWTSIEKPDPQVWTFAELKSAYKRVAAFIRRHSYHQRMIAVCLDRRLEAYAVILGILDSGNTYLPIDEELPDERKAFLMKDSQAVTLFTTRTLAPAFSKCDARHICVDQDTYKEQMCNGDVAEPEIQPQPIDNAYLLYTSGSTGVPKGVLVGRGNLCSFVEGLSEFIRPLIPGMVNLPGHGKYLGLASRAFDVHLAEMFLAWRSGLAAVTAPRATLLDDLESALRAMKITHASFVPSLIDQLGLNPKNLPDLHYLGVGGEKMSRHCANTWAASPNAALVNAYGPTEMSIGCTAAEVRPRSKLNDIGCPYGNSVIHVLVPGSNQHTLRGVAGELCFTGSLVANGYHNRPDAKGFVDDINGKRMYRTGDIVRLRVDDTLEYLRREDDQTKVRGQRLELGEISEAVRTSMAADLGHARVDVATMVAQHPQLPRPQLVNFVVPLRETNGDSARVEILPTAKEPDLASKVQDQCRKVLPAYMVPDVVLPLTGLPLAPSSGKADVKQLKSLFANMPLEDVTQRSGEAHPSRQEMTKVEQEVRAVVARSLAVDESEISADTNIFRIGLESLSAIGLAINMQKLGFECSVSSVLKNPSVEKLALLSRTRKQSPDEKPSAVVSLEDRFRNTKGIYRSFQAVKPCLPLQETLVAAALADKSRTLYVNNVVLELAPGVELEQLRKAWKVCVADHDILRTCFREFEDAIIQAILPPNASRVIFWEDADTADPEVASRHKESQPSQDIIAEMNSRPPCRLTLFRSTSENQRSRLLIQIHHALYDAESFAMILEDLEKRYHSSVVPAHTPFASLIDYVASQNQQESKDFWKRYLQDYQPVQVMKHTTADEPLLMDRLIACSVTRLAGFAASISGTLTSTIQAVFGIALAQTLGVHDVVFGAVLSGRTVPIKDAHSIIAPCITTIPQRVNLSIGTSAIMDIIKTAQKGFVESLTYQHTALRHIHRWVEAKQPLFDSLVTYVQRKQKAKSSLWTELEGSMANDFPLSMEFEADYESNEMRVHCAFSPAFGDPDRAASLLENIDLLLGALVRAEHVTTEDIGISMDSMPKASSQSWDDSEWSPVELKMRDVAAEVCGIDASSISRAASFFSLGIDSITAIRFARQLRQLDITCSSADVMRHAYIGALAQEVDNRNTSSKPNGKQEGADLHQLVPKVPLLSGEDVVMDLYTCTPLQSSMLTQTLGSDGRMYAHHHGVRLSVSIDLSRLKQAWEVLAAQTEVLRTTFHFFESIGSWIGAIHQASLDAWKEHHIGSLASESLMKLMKDFQFRHETSFDRPPWMVTVARNGSEATFILSLHHSLYDGVSVNLLFEDLAKMYVDGNLHPRPPFSDAARAIVSSSSEAEDFWLQKLEGFENNTEPNLPGTDSIGIDHTVSMAMPRTLQGCKQMGVTLQTVTLLAFAKTLACHSKQRDVVFGHVVGGRALTIPDADAIIGPLFNTVPARVLLYKTYTTNETMVREMQKTSGDSQIHQHASLGKVQKSWRRSTSNHDARLIDAIFVFTSLANIEASNDDLWAPLSLGNTVDPTEYSMNLEVEQRSNSINLKANAKMHPKQLQDWLKTFEQSFEDIIDNPTKNVLACPTALQSLPLHAEVEKACTTSQKTIEPGLYLDAIRAALAETSKIPQRDISTDASIFSLGLDSISAIQVAATCRSRGYTISVADILQGRSLGGICRRLRGGSQEVPDVDDLSAEPPVSDETRSKAMVMVGVKEKDVEFVLPCSAGQVYHLASWVKSLRKSSEGIFAYQCPHALNVDSLRLAWRGLRHRHSILRTLFVAVTPDEAVQVATSPSAVGDESFQCIESQTSITDHIKEQAQQHFDFSSPPCLLRLVHGPTENHIIVKLHHATYDAWTLPSIISDLIDLYNGSPSPEALSFAPFITQILQSRNSHSSQSYWRKTLDGGERTFLPTLSSNQSTTTSTTLRPAIRDLHTLDSTCHAASLSLSTIILTAFARILANRTTTANPVFGLYQTGRSTGNEALSAPCLNVTPVCVHDALTKSTTESARGLQDNLAERVPHEQSYLTDILEVAGFGQSEPLFNCYVNILAPPPTTSSAMDQKSTFTPCGVKDEVYLFASSSDSHPPSKFETTTPVDELDTKFLAQKNLYLDVVRDEVKGCMDFAVKCDGAVMDEARVRRFMEEVVIEVEGCVRGL